MLKLYIGGSLKGVWSLGKRFGNVGFYLTKTTPIISIQRIEEFLLPL